MALAVITLARDADLETLPDGAEQIYWSDPSTWGMSAGAAGVRHQVMILSATPNTYLTLIGQYSIDGRSWFDFDGTVDGVATPTPVGATSELSIRQYSGPPEEMAPFVRYGLRTWRTGGLQGRVRLSCDLIVLPSLDAARLMVADGVSVTGAGTIGATECTYGYDRGSFLIYSNAFTLTTVTVVVETSVARDAPDQMWRPLTTVPALATFNAASQEQYVEVAGLDGYTRIRATATTGTGAGTFTAYAFLRPAT